MIEYEAGAKPSRPMTLVVRDELDNPINVISYDSWRLEMLDTDDRLVDLTGVTITEIPQAIGVFSVSWPKDRSLFNRKGQYLLRLILENADGSKDITRAGEIRVRDFGRIR